MRQSTLLGRASSITIAVAIAAFAAACQKNTPVAPANVDQAATPVATLPLSDGPPPPLAPAPPVSALPPHPLPVRQVATPRDRYAFAERAGEAAYGFGDAPPDYAFDYYGSR